MGFQDLQQTNQKYFKVIKADPIGLQNLTNPPYTSMYFCLRNTIQKYICFVPQIFGQSLQKYSWELVNQKIVQVWKRNHASSQLWRWTDIGFSLNASLLVLLVSKLTDAMTISHLLPLISNLVLFKMAVKGYHSEVGIFYYHYHKEVVYYHCA